jgi:hypothetical protein
VSNEKPRNDLQRRAIEDLVRIEAEVGKLLPLTHEALLRPATNGAWSPSEFGLHIVLTLEDCCVRFQQALSDSSIQSLQPTWTQKMAQKAVLVTFRFPTGKQADPGVTPQIMLDRETILHRLISSRDSLLDLERKLQRGDSQPFVAHPILGPMSFYSWIRVLLIHLLHHKLLMSKGLG